MKKKKDEVVDIETRMLRRSPSDIIYLGDIVEKYFINTELNPILTALTQGRISKEAKEAKRGVVNAERILGRIEMADQLVDDLTQYVYDRNEMKKPKKRKGKEVETALASEPDIPDTQTFSYGGDI